MKYFSAIKEFFISQSIGMYLLKAWPTGRCFSLHTFFRCSRIYAADGHMSMERISSRRTILAASRYLSTSIMQFSFGVYLFELWTLVLLLGLGEIFGPLVFLAVMEGANVVLFYNIRYYLMFSTLNLL